MYWGSIFHALQILVNFYNVIRPGLLIQQQKQSTAMESNEQRLGATVHSTAVQSELIVRDSINSNHSKINNNNKASDGDELNGKNTGLKELTESDESALTTQKMNNYLSLNNFVFHHHDKRSSHRGGKS